SRARGAASWRAPRRGRGACRGCPCGRASASRSPPDGTREGCRASPSPGGILRPTRDNRRVLLAVDVGNTQTHLGAFEGERLAEHWRFQTRSGATGDELAERIAGLFSLCGMSFDDVDAVCVSSVVPPLGSQFEELTGRYLDAECLTIGPGVKTGMPIRIENPL